MADSYNIEHNVPTPSSNPSSQPPRRPDLSTFFSTLDHVDTTETTNTHALPLPSEVSAAFRTLAEAFASMRQQHSGDDDGPLDSMIDSLLHESESPPREVKGVSQSFLDELERVPRKALKEGMDCPICGNPFLEDEYPLVVRLPCDRKHMFDLECIAPWLRLHATCPLDRRDLLKGGKTEREAREEEERMKKEEAEEEDEEWDDMYA